MPAPMAVRGRRMFRQRGFFSRQRRSVRGRGRLTGLRTNRVSEDGSRGLRAMAIPHRRGQRRRAGRGWPRRVPSRGGPLLRGGPRRRGAWRVAGRAGDRIGRLSKHPCRRARRRQSARRDRSGRRRVFCPRGRCRRAGRRPRSRRRRLGADGLAKRMIPHRPARCFPLRIGFPRGTEGMCGVGPPW